MFKFTFIILLACVICRHERNLQNDSVSTQIFNVTNSGQTNLVVKQNVLVSINLEGNPTTGYIWYLKDDSNIDSNFITTFNLNNDTELKGFKSTTLYSPSTTSQVLNGMGGIFTFNFLPLNLTKNIQLNFVYMRPFAPNDGPTYASVVLQKSELFGASSHSSFLQSCVLHILILFFFIFI